VLVTIPGPSGRLSAGFAFSTGVAATTVAVTGLAFAAAFGDAVRPQ
jgi:hypothetical protein